MLLATCSLTNEAKSEAKGLKSDFMSFKAIFLLTFWVKVLQCIDNRSLILQSGNISLDTESAHFKALQEDIQALCHQWDALLTEASMVANEMGGTAPFHSEQRSRQKKRKCFPDETEDDIANEQKSDTGFHNTVFYVALDSIISHLDMRFHMIAAICKFSPIHTYRKMTENQICVSCHKLRNKYSKDLTDGK